MVYAMPVKMAGTDGKLIAKVAKMGLATFTGLPQKAGKRSSPLATT